MNVQFRDPISDTERGSENDIKTGRDAGARPVLTEVMIITTVVSFARRIWYDRVIIDWVVQTNLGSPHLSISRWRVVHDKQPEDK